MAENQKGRGRSDSSGSNQGGGKCNRGLASASEAIKKKWRAKVAAVVVKQTQHTNALTKPFRRFSF